MPIKPENRARYPDDWDEIRERILTRAGQVRNQDGVIIQEAQCEECGEVNHTWIIREGDRWNFALSSSEEGAIYVILTIAHLDHNPETRDPKLLRAWCQRQHNRYDLEHRKQTRRATRERNQLQLEITGGPSYG